MKKSKKTFSQMAQNGDLPWYKVKDHLKQKPRKGNYIYNINLNLIIQFLA